MKLLFHRGNAKLPSYVHTFSLPAGWTCPGAKLCKSKVVKARGRYAVKDSKGMTHRCYATSEEVLFPNVRANRNANWALLKATMGGLATQRDQSVAMALLILGGLPGSSLPTASLAVDGAVYTSILRVHASGDFFCQAYMDAWLMVARLRKDILFYAYTKSLLFWSRRLASIPDNMVLTASAGGTHDHLIGELGLRSARVVFSKQEAIDLGLAIDHDDGLAMRRGPSFALLLHGVQPAGSAAASALAELRRHGEYGYGERADWHRRQSLPLL